MEEDDSRQYLPRKGTETVGISISPLLRQTEIPDNIYPARGRKRNMQSNLPPFQGKNSRQYLPRKGTETRDRIIFFDCTLISGDSRQYLPRKGTETPQTRAEGRY